MIDNRRGIFWALISAVSAGSMTVIIRGAGDFASSTQIVFFRFFLSLICLMLAIIFVKKLREKISFQNPLSHLTRGVLLGVATHLGFYAITSIPINRAAVLFFTAPIFATLLSVFFQNEQIGIRRMLAIAAGFLGAIIVCQPQRIGLGYGEISALAASLLFAFGLVMSRNLATKDGVFSVITSSAIVSTLISVPFVASKEAWSIEALGWILLTSLAFLGILRNIADVEQYHWGDAAIIAPFAYLRLLVVALGAYLFFNEIPDLATLIGGAIIIASALYIAFRERRLRPQ